MTQNAMLEVDASQYGSITEAIVCAVGAVQNERPTELESLYESVDPDALERLFSFGAPVSVAFEYAGLSVSITADETIRVSETEEAVEATSD